MKKTSKVKTIFRAFTQRSSIDPIELKKRREICKLCPYNSANKDKKDLGLLSTLRTKVISEPFCTACGCQIKEKTTQETEECGLSSIDKEPKWNRIKIETLNKEEMNIINKSTDLVNIDIASDGESYQVNYGVLSKQSDTTIELLLQADSGQALDVKYFKPSCGSCTTASCDRVDEETFKVVIHLDLSTINGVFTKYVNFSYKIGSDFKKSKLILTGKVQ